MFFDDPIDEVFYGYGRMIIWHLSTLLFFLVLRASTKGGFKSCLCGFLDVERNMIWKILKVGVQFTFLCTFFLGHVGSCITIWRLSGFERRAWTSIQLSSYSVGSLVEVLNDDNMFH
ncbi:hypothetical protein MTR67_001927 [Solanum verrucosum]|uniref:Uncharacterized protein n=1 Tax=Solanum verrucosum TaxID=315347 RepID=A0AAF0T5F9_SOLVR|nr:hypothetical protein MTR67_001927 [Solanum verrucosum]